MTQYSVQPRDWIFVKGYGYLVFAKNMGKNKSRILSFKYSQKLLDHAKQSATDALKTSSKRVIQKTAEATRELTGNELQKSQENHCKIIQKQLQINMIKNYLKKDERRKTENYWWYDIEIIV